MSKVGNDYEIRINKVISDSRCPEGVNCVWAGEVELVLFIYKENNIVKEEVLTFNYKTLEENKAFLKKYTSGRKILNIKIIPIKNKT